LLLTVLIVASIGNTYAPNVKCFYILKDLAKIEKLNGQGNMKKMKLFI
jgi:hypothetical protein